jgi:putative endopeptidase
MSPTPPHNIKCPCCNNPWAAATGDFFAKFCQVCETEEPQGNGLSRSNMDFDIHPKDNFYLYSNGNWLKNNPIPSGYPNWNSFLTLHVQSQENLKDILVGLAAQKQDNITGEERKLSAFYKAAMDEDAIETLGVEPIQPLLQECRKTVDAAKQSNKSDFAQCLGSMAYHYGIFPFFGIGVSPDKKNSELSIAQISQGGIGLPDRDYYFDEDKEEQREAYKKFISMMLTLLDDTTAKEPTDANVALSEKVFHLEYSLAEAHMTRTENRDPHETYNKMSIAELSTKCCNDQFDFASYFLAATGKDVEGLGDINVVNTKALERAAKVASCAEPETLLAYLCWKVVVSCAPYLSKAFVDQHFDFFEKTMMGTTEIKPRWKRAMTFTESALGEALGKLYCANYFDETSKERALDIVEKVRRALEDRLKEVDWIKAESTRSEALKKMGRFRVKIG